MLNDYFKEITNTLERVKEQEEENLHEAAKMIADCIENDGVVHLFGCGHSHLLAEEVFYRAGGLAPIHPLLMEDFMLHKGPVRSTKLERMNGAAQAVMEHQDIRKGDVMVVISNSGINPVPIDVALIAKEKGAATIGLTSVSYSKSRPSRHVKQNHLYEVVDLVIDNHTEAGDALIKHEGVKAKSGPSSTVVGAAILNGIFVQAVQLLIDRGIDPPVFLSGNLKGADEHNQQLIDKYKKRIPLLRQ
ncbi:SIS domain-containing protein [Halalkalibacterium ligniniphilum]|uniref:SIS domain-containing protein n=1 Tax=Halalkalibacterium ligniniphilum TaxID=1134413 RepID=UPI000347B6FA|nr:SIS domain-containing protein [Halalkalibacterium ligniniphilum]